MAINIQANLKQIIDLSADLKRGSVGNEEAAFLDIIYRNALELHEQNVQAMPLSALSQNSHDLRQYVTSIVGYSALLNSPKLADHASLSPEQLKSIYALHDHSRGLHWWLDSLILFAIHFVREESRTARDVGMLNIRGYLLAQADHYLCRQRLQEINVPEDIPLVYANDIRTKLMLRGLFVAAMELTAEPDLHLSAYTMMKVVRVKLLALKLADHVAELQPQLVRPTTEPHRAVQGQVLQSLSLLEMGLRVAADMALRQGGRLKVEADKDDLLFTLTMPTSPHQYVI